MGLGFRRSINVGGGVRLNLSKGGFGASVGTTGLRTGLGPSGARSRSTLPGTGLYYEQRKGLSRPARKQELAFREQRQQQDKQEALQEAELEVGEYETYLELLTSVHKECSEAADWKQMAEQEPPFDEEEVGPSEQEAREEAENYSPGFFERLFHKDDDKKEQLQQAVLAAREEDHDLYDEWEATQEVAERVLAGDPKAYKMAVETMAPFDDIVDLGSAFDFHFVDADTVELAFHVESRDVIPTRVKSLTKTGKVSNRKLGKTKYFGYYQDYVCSCVIRVARELFALLPVQHVKIEARNTQLNTATGHDEEVLILVVAINRPKFENINFERIDCSDALEHFEHHMDFLKTKGFREVKRLQ